MGIRDRRSALRVPAVFAVKSLLRGRVQLGQAEDLGPGGMTLRRLPDVPAAQGATISLAFDLPGEGLLPGEASALLKVSGVVVSDAPAGSFRRTGVRFHALPGEVVQRITRFCEAQEQALKPEAAFAPGAVASG
jgi:hypothetical protein